MRITRYRTALAGALVLLFAGVLGAQTLATRHVMEVKLARSQRILESLMMSDFETLQRESQALSELTNEIGWAVLGTPEYIRYSSAFISALSDLKEAAQNRDLDAAMLHYVGVTMTCYQCHRYLKNARIADVVPVADDGADGQRPQNRRPPPKASPRPRSAPRAQPRVRPRVEIFPYPFVFAPDLYYRFPYGLYPYYRWGYPYPRYGYGSVEFDVTPRTATVFVDGYYAGTIDDFDERLHVIPGPHHIDVEAPGMETISFDIDVLPNQTIKYRAVLQPSVNGSTEERRRP